MMNPFPSLRFTLCFTFFLLVLTAGAQNTTFSKYLAFSANSQMSNSVFTNCHQLKHQNGYLLTAERYTSLNVRNTMLVRTDTALHEVWSTMLNFNNAALPYDNISFSDVGELLNGNYYLFGQTAVVGTPYYLVFVLDTNGNILNYTSLHDAQNASNASVIPQLRVADDSSLIITISEYERSGFYRLDQNLNLLSSGLYNTNSSSSWGRDGLLLPGGTLLLAGYGNGLVLTKTTLNGNIIWSKSYPDIGHCFSICQAPGGSVYVGGSVMPNNGSAVSFVAKLDTAGQLSWYHTFNMVNSLTMSAIWNIYPDGNKLMLYSDSIMFEIDSLGFPVSSGFTVNSYNFKVMKPCSPHDFMLAGPIFQDAVQDYRHTIMRFDINTVSGCLHPRSVLTTVRTSTSFPAFPNPVPHNLQTQNIVFSDTTVQMKYDLFNGCPPNLNGISEHSGTPGTAFIFPNPASDELTVHYVPKKENAVLTFELLDVNGRIVQEGRPDSFSENEFRLSVAGLAEGIYSISVYEDGVPYAHVLCCVKH